MQETVKLPQLGEDVVSGTVVKVLVKPGDAVARGDSLIEIETGKAIVPVPSPVSGKIVALSVSAGQEIKVGQTLAVIEIQKRDNSTNERRGDVGGRAPDGTEPNSDKQQSVSKVSVDLDRWRRVPAGFPQAAGPLASEKSIAIVTAGPAARKLARELGVEINYVTGTRKGGRVDKEDVKAYVRDLMRLMREVRKDRNTFTLAPIHDFTRFGAVERKSLSALRKTVAARMSASWAEIPHVFHFHEIDISEPLKDLGALKKKGKPITLTAVLVKALASIFQDMPSFNASLDPENNVLILKKDVHIGIAVDTEAGLIVPVLKNADEKGVEDIARELARLAEGARARTLKPEELQGASFTLSNLGGIGGGAFTPLINPPQVAILGVGRTTIRPVYENKAWVPTPFLPVTLSYDHRVIDGADAARFLVRLEEALKSLTLVPVV